MLFKQNLFKIFNGLFNGYSPFLYWGRAPVVCLHRIWTIKVTKFNVFVNCVNLYMCVFVYSVFV